MLSDDERSFKSEVNADFEKNIPSIFLTQINKTFESTKTHLEQLKSLHYFYRIIRYYHTPDYLSKSRLRFGGVMPMCKNPFEEGTIENAVLLLEKQYFDSLLLLLNGSYRPIMIILRYMLELSTWIAASIIDKKLLTHKPADSKKAMSQIEFESFLLQNYENMDKIMSPSTPKDEKRNLHTIRGLIKIPYTHIKNLENEQFSGMNYIKAFHSKLSRYAHANIWRTLRVDGGDEETNIESVGLFIGKPSSEGYHISLSYIIKAHEIIFYLLIAAAYENLGYYQQDEAKEYLTFLGQEFDEIKKILKYSSIEKLLKNPPQIQRSPDDFNNTDVGSINEDEDNEEDMECPECGYPMFRRDELCIGCHVKEYGQGGNTAGSIF